MGSPASPGDSTLQRVLIRVGGERDGELTRALLAKDGLASVVCKSDAELCAAIEEGAAAALLAEEVLTPTLVKALQRTLAGQPPWSDFPLVIFGGGADRSRALDDGLKLLGNVTLLDRPVQVRSMLAAVRSGIRSRRRQYEARKAIESRDQFLAMLGHELRNPLGAIRLAVSLLDEKADGESPREHAIIARQSAHLTRLVDDLLDVARITHGKVVLKRERLSLTDIVRRACETLEPLARGAGLTCTLETADDALWVDGDSQRLEQVFINLITNAIKYTPAGGSIRVQASGDRERVSVRVVDTGIGIAEDMLGRVFDAFAQADRSLDRAEGGIGLGLALVRSVVELHHGTIEAQSPGIGLGSTFTLELPRLSSAEVPGLCAAPAPSLESARRRVVVVEDNADIRELLSDLLRLGGHEVIAKQDGLAGLSEILANGPDVAFVDLGLPGIDGLEVARRARASGCRARLIALSGYGQVEDKLKARDAGFDEHLTKPIVGADIARALAHSA